METRKWKCENEKGTHVADAKQSIPASPSFCFLISIFFLALGCGAPGDPTPPSAQIPVVISDLAAHQAGDGVQLLFSPPKNATSGEKLAAPATIEILRGAMKPDGSPDPKSFRLVYVIPGALVDNYGSGGRVRFTDPVAPEETKSHPGSIVAYMVRTRVSAKRASANSNVVSLRLFPVPAPISSIEVRVTESAIELSWTVPMQTSAGGPLSAVAGYRIYRVEANPSADAPSATVPSQGKGEALAEALAFSETNSYRDATFRFDRTYVYTVRTVMQVEGVEIESSDSQPVTVTPRDIFPPAAPQGLVGALLPGASAGEFVVDLSWSINLETDLAGYRVYKSEQEGVRGQLLTPDLLLTPAVRDTSVQPGHRFWYTVTAVDRAGNESAPSAAVAIDVTRPSP